MTVPQIDIIDLQYRDTMPHTTVKQEYDVVKL